MAVTLIHFACMSVRKWAFILRFWKLYRYDTSPTLHWVLINSLTGVKFLDIFRFSRQVVTLIACTGSWKCYGTEWCQSVSCTVIIFSQKASSNCNHL